MVLACFLGGSDVRSDDRLLNDCGQYDAECAANRMSDAIHDRLEAALLDLFGLVGEQPAWASDAGIPMMTKHDTAGPDRSTRLDTLGLDAPEGAKVDH